MSKKTILIVLGVALFGCAGLFALLGGGNDDARVTAPSEPAGGDEAAAPTDEPAEPAAPAAMSKVGEAVKVGDSRVWTVVSVEDRGQLIESGNQFIEDLTTTGRFLYITATIENTGDDAFFIDTPKVVDSREREFDHNSDGVMLIPDDSRCVLEELNPGISRTCAWIYEVPADATGLGLKVGGALFDKAAVVDLGQ